MEAKRANTTNQLSDVELDQYLAPKEFGTFIGTLDYKMWGKSTNLWAYFTLDAGEKIKLSCFRSRKNEAIYSARDEKYNFSLIGNEGKKFKLSIKLTSKNTINFDTAELI